MASLRTIASLGYDQEDLGPRRRPFGGHGASSIDFVAIVREGSAKTGFVSCQPAGASGGPYAPKWYILFRPGLCKHSGKIIQ
jgi:hypothetical protein